MYFYVEPEVSGGLGNETVIDSSTHPPIVSALHYQFHGWLGDEIIESFPCYIVSKSLKESIESHRPTGVSFSAVKISKSEQFLDLYPNKVIPNFYWLKASGKVGFDDFGISDDFRLVVSSKILQSFQKHHFKNADIEPYKE